MNVLLALLYSMVARAKGCLPLLFEVLSLTVMPLVLAVCRLDRVWAVD